METEPTLDKSRPYGVIYGEPKMAFEQDGVHFKADGSVLERWTTPEALANERVLAQKRLANEERLARQRALEAQRKKLLEDK